MTTVPRPYPEAIDWITNRLASWTADPAAIGLDAAEVADLTALTSTATTALQDAQQANDAKLNATATYHNAGDEMRSTATALVAKVRAFAKASSDPTAVYTAASIPAPADRAPTPPPGTPYDFRIELLQGGAVTIRFKCDNPGNVAGVTYKVERQDASQGAFAFITNAGERSFTDSTIPAGASQVVYRITAQRSTQSGPLAQFLVQFGGGNEAQVIGQPSMAA